MIEFLTCFVIVLVVIYIIYLFIKRKIKLFFRKYFNVMNLEQVIDMSNDVDTPKSVGGMEKLYLPQLMNDFPDLNINDLKAETEKNILKCFDNVSTGILDSKFNLSEKVKLWIKNNSLSKDANSWKVHNTVLNKYEKKDSICTLIFRTSLEYKVKEKKVQTVIETEYIYIVDENKYAKYEKAIGLNCPNCGAPIKNLGHKYCTYCGTGIIELVKKCWIFNNIREL